MWPWDGEVAFSLPEYNMCILDKVSISFILTICSTWANNQIKEGNFLHNSTEERLATKSVKKDWNVYSQENRKCGIR